MDIFIHFVFVIFEKNVHVDQWSLLNNRWKFGTPIQMHNNNNNNNSFWIPCAESTSYSFRGDIIGRFIFNLPKYQKILIDHYTTWCYNIVTGNIVTFFILIFLFSFWTLVTKFVCRWRLFWFDSIMQTTIQIAINRT